MTCDRPVKSNLTPIILFYNFVRACRRLFLRRGRMRFGHDLICPVCGIHFFICASCYRCQKYCSPTCRKTGYSAKQKIVRKKYADTPEARADHCDCNKLYRVYGRQCAIVMDETSDKDLDSLSSISISPNKCTFCGVRRNDENMELFTVTPDRW